MNALEVDILRCGISKKPEMDGRGGGCEGPVQRTIKKRGGSGDSTVERRGKQDSCRNPNLYARGLCENAGRQSISHPDQANNPLRKRPSMHVGPRSLGELVGEVGR